MPAFASYLCSFEHTRKGTHTFAVDRGDAHSRRSVLNLEMDHKGLELLALRVAVKQSCLPKVLFFYRLNFGTIKVIFGEEYTQLAVFSSIFCVVKRVA